MFSPPRFSRRAFLPLLAALVVPLTAHAQQAKPTPPPVDPDAILSALKEIKTKQAQIIGKAKKDVMVSINNALADPVKAYEQAVVAVELQGGNEGARVAEWRKQKGELLRNRDFANALRLQLSYIALTWQRSMGAKNKEMLASLYDYTNQITAAQETLAPFEKQLGGSLGRSVFTPYFQIGPYISGLPDWSDQPFDVDSIYTKAILPVLRETKDPRALDYWDAKLRLEAARFTKDSSALVLNKFNTVRRPTLQWNRAEELTKIGEPNRAMIDMLALIRAHPDHPDFDKWAGRLTELANSSRGEVLVLEPSAPPAQ